MADITQSQADKGRVGQITDTEADGLVYTQIGGIRFYTGTGVPEHTTGIKGCLCVDVATGKLYYDSDGAGTWVWTGADE